MRRPIAQSGSNQETPQGDAAHGFQQQVADLSKVKAELQERVATLQSDIDALERQKTHKQNELVELSKSAELAEEKKTALGKDIRALENTLSERKTSLRTLEEQKRNDLATVITSSEVIIVDKKKELASIEKILSEKAAELRAADKKIESSGAELASLQKEFETVRERLADLRNSMQVAVLESEKLEKTKQYLLSLQAEIIRIENHKKGIVEQTKELLGVLAEKKTEVAEKLKKVAELDKNISERQSAARIIEESIDFKVKRLKIAEAGSILKEKIATHG